MVEITDASGGDYELLRAQWSGLLSFSSYDVSQLADVAHALASCAGDSSKDEHSQWRHKGI